MENNSITKFMRLVNILTPYRFSLIIFSVTLSRYYHVQDRRRRQSRPCTSVYLLKTTLNRTLTGCRQTAIGLCNEAVRCREHKMEVNKRNGCRMQIIIIDYNLPRTVVNPYAISIQITLLKTQTKDFMSSSAASTNRRSSVIGSDTDLVGLLSYMQPLEHDGWRQH